MLVAACTADVAGIEGRQGEVEEETGSGGPNQTSITLSTYFDKIAKVYCDQAFSCRATFPTNLGYTFEAQWGNNHGECISRLVTAWNPALVETEIAKGRVTYDGTAAVSCLEGVTLGACGDYWTNGIDWAESCYHVVVGTVQVGGLCDSNYSCTSYACDATTHTCL